MRKLLYAGIFLWSTSLLAQNDAVTNAFLYNKDGEYDKAKAEIDRAVLHEKTRDKDKTWYFRGMIYKNILETKGTKDFFIAQDAAAKAYESYMKCIELKKDGDFFAKSKFDLRNLAVSVFNCGVGAFNKGKADEEIQKKEDAMKYYQSAVALFEISSEALGGDTSSILNAISAANKLPDFQKFKNLTYKVFSLGKRTPELYFFISSKAKQTGLRDTSLFYIIEGRKYFPNDRTLMGEEIQYYLDSEKTDIAIKKLEAGIAADSSLVDYFPILGGQYQRLSNSPKATPKEKEMYDKKALDIFIRAVKRDPKNEVSSFNVGKYYYDKGLALIAKANKIDDIKLMTTVVPKLQNEAAVEFKKALPYFESCYQNNKNDKTIRQALKNTYEYLKRSADADKIPD